MNTLPVGLQGRPPVGGLGLLLAPESSSQEEEEGGRKVIGAAWDPMGPWSRVMGAPPRSPQDALGSLAEPRLSGCNQLHTHVSFLAARLVLPPFTGLPPGRRAHVQYF